MSKDTRGIDEPKHHPGAAGDPRRQNVSARPSRSKPARQVGPKSSPEGYAEEQPGKSAGQEPQNNSPEPSAKARPKGASAAPRRGKK